MNWSHERSNKKSREGDKDDNREEEDDSKDSDVDPMDAMVDNDLCACTSARNKEGKCMAGRWKDIEGNFLSIVCEDCTMHVAQTGNRRASYGQERRKLMDAVRLKRLDTLTFQETC